MGSFDRGYIELDIAHDFLGLHYEAFCPVDLPFRG
jgi:hypothetical protein